MARLGETVAVVNKSGKVVSNSKSLIGVFKEAKSIYGERKAEIKAKRKFELEEQRTRRNLDDLALDDTRSRASSRRRRKPSSRHHNHQNRRPERPAAERGFTDTTHHASRSPHDTDSLPPPYPRHELTRRHTDGGLVSPSSAKPRAQNYARSAVSDETDDPHLAYGDLPITDLPQSRSPRGHPNQEVELRDKMFNLTRLLDEANCLQHSVTTMIEVLQKDPDRLAAVGLALAEISTLARAAAPGALVTMKSTFPAAMALLASPQFMVAGGVALGVTVVALGGYKIIKRIKAQQEEGNDLDFFASFDKRDIFGKLRSISGGGQKKGHQHVDEIREIGGDLSRIELWRQGIADAEAGSVGTSVDGEFVTQNAGRQLVDEGVLQPGQVRLSPSTTDADGRRSASKSKSGEKKKHKDSRSGRENGRDRSRERERERERTSRRDNHHHHHHEHTSHKSKSERSERSERSDRSDRSVRDGDSESTRHRKKKAIKDKEPSGLKMIFKK